MMQVCARGIPLIRMHGKYVMISQRSPQKSQELAAHHPQTKISCCAVT